MTNLLVRKTQNIRPFSHILSSSLLQMHFGIISLSLSLSLTLSTFLKSSLSVFPFGLLKLELPWEALVAAQGRQWACSGVNRVDKHTGKVAQPPVGQPRELKHKPPHTIDLKDVCEIPIFCLNNNKPPWKWRGKTAFRMTKVQGKRFSEEALGHAADSPRPEGQPSRPHLHQATGSTKEGGKTASRRLNIGL